MSVPVLTPQLDTLRRELSEQLADPGAAARLRSGIGEARRSGRPGVLNALEEVCNVLDGGGWEPVGSPEPAARLGGTLREQLVVHPREKRERQHQLASVLSKILHLFRGSDMARAVARVTEAATPPAYPGFCRLLAQCAATAEMEPPAVRVARGEERLFAVLLDRSPFLCVHRDFVALEERSPLPAPAVRFGIGRCLEHLRGGHAALLQLSPDVLEAMVLDELPFLVRHPVKLASKVVGWTRANEAVRRVGERLPQQSAGQRMANTLGDLLPEHGQETVLPEAVHAWVRSWIQGVELSADRGGLLQAGSVSAACEGLLRFSPLVDADTHVLRGARPLLTTAQSRERELAERLRELLRFALSEEYLATR
ncbi:MAG: hypothetical protein ACK47B_19460 [Armatimonadota bacterium]